jgi:hypothetical protein
LLRWAKTGPAGGDPGKQHRLARMRAYLPTMARRAATMIACPEERVASSSPVGLPGRVLRDAPLTRDHRAAAHHEAGHAVARLVHGLSFERAFINDDGTGAVVVGHSRAGAPWGGAIRALAGPIAEAHHTGQPVAEMLADLNSGEDFRQAQAALAAAGREMAEALAVAEYLVDECWPAIVAIAAVLEAKGEIREPQAIAIINATLAPEEV